MTLLELAERCEAADRPSANLDRDIRRAWKIDASPSNFTSSLDAALTLVPEGWDWLRESWETMLVYPLRDRDAVDHDRDCEGRAATPALALCAAALRARASS